MSRLDDIIELIQTTNEVYFITAPGRVRTAYILVDDILELALKTFLQEKTNERRDQCRAALVSERIVNVPAHHKALTRFFEDDIDFDELCKKLGQTTSTAPTNLQNHLNKFQNLNHWSANDPEARKEFQDVILEAKQEFPLPAEQTSPPVWALLDEALNRHKTRNKFYHDHHQAGLTINDEKCLSALCDLFDLMGYLFPVSLDDNDENKPVRSFSRKAKKNHTVLCQIGVIQLKKAASLGHQELSKPYNAALEQLKKDHQYGLDTRAVEHSLVHTVSERFFRALKVQFKEAIDEHHVKINKIDNAKRATRKNHINKADKLELIQILQRQLDQINTLLGTP